MSKTTDYVIEVMNELKEIKSKPWFPGQGGKIRKLEEKYNLIQSHGGGIIKKIKNK